MRFGWIWRGMPPHIMLSEALPSLHALAEISYVLIYLERGAV